jgi:hypothetical protein
MSTGKSGLLEEIRALDGKDDYFGIMRLIEKQREPDYALTLEYVRACVNAAATVQDGFRLLELASSGLDSWASEGHADPRWLFYKGVILYRQGMIPDAMNRFKKALEYVKVGDPENLLTKCNAMLEQCRGRMIESEFPGLKAEDAQAVKLHVKEHFGNFVKLGESYKTEILRVPPSAEHPFQLLVTCGLAGRALPVPEGYDAGVNARLELCLALPEQYDFQGDRERNWEVFMLVSMIEHVITSDHFIGFGYYADKENGFDDGGQFTGLMLTGLGDYSGECQQVQLASGSLARFYQLIPLKPYECAYRATHSAMDLLRLFAEKKTPLTPFYSGRADLCAQIGAARV